MAIPLVDAAVGIVGTLVERIFPDKEKQAAERAAALLELTKLQQSGDLAVIAGQIEINKIEAASPLTFISGWRPAVGWICVTALGVDYVIRPIAEWGTALAGHPVKFPELDIATLMTLLIGMLGLGGMRTVEKLRDVASK